MYMLFEPKPFSILVYATFLFLSYNLFGSASFLIFYPSLYIASFYSPRGAP